MWKPALGVDRRESMMIFNQNRIGYLGRTGTHDVRVVGATAIYVSLDKPFTIACSGLSREAFLAVVPAHEPHKVHSSDPYGAQLLIEPETIDDPILRNDLGFIGQREIAERIIAGFGVAPETGLTSDEFDKVFFGRVLVGRRLDRRVRISTERVVADPAARHMAEIHAMQVRLSASRFSHLFRAETGSTFRRFCAWKRARGFLPLVTCDEKLVETALSAGYADSTHFSHSVRKFFGVRPRDLVDIIAARDFRVLALDVPVARFAI